MDSKKLWDELSGNLQETNSVSRKRSAAIRKAALMLLGCYRTGDANDPEVYVAAVVAVLSDYSLDVVDAVTNARNGIPSKLKWLPTVAEIKTACEDIAGPRRRFAEWEARSRAQIEERQRLAAPPGNTEHERITDGFKQLRTYLRPDEANKENQFTPKKVKAKFGLTDAQWDAIPDAPPDSSWRKLQG